MIDGSGLVSRTSVAAANAAGRDDPGPKLKAMFVAPESQTFPGLVRDTKAAVRIVISITSKAAQRAGL